MINSKQICFVPPMLYKMVIFQDKPLSVLADLEQVSEIFGVETASTLSLLNDLYDDGMAKNIYPSPEQIGLQKIDLLNNNGSLSEKNPDLFNLLRSRGEARRMSGYVDVFGDPKADIQYLELFNITPQIVGATISSEPLANDQETKKKISLKLMGFLHRYGVNIHDVLATEMYKEVIRLSIDGKNNVSLEGYFEPLYRKKLQQQSDEPTVSNEGHVWDFGPLFGRKKKDKENTIPDGIEKLKESFTAIKVANKLSNEPLNVQIDVGYLGNTNRINNIVKFCQYYQSTAKSILKPLKDHYANLNALIAKLHNGKVDNQNFETMFHLEVTRMFDCLTKVKKLGNAVFEPNISNHTGEFTTTIRPNPVFLEEAITSTQAKQLKDSIIDSIDIVNELNQISAIEIGQNISDWIYGVQDDLEHIGQQILLLLGSIK